MSYTVTIRDIQYITHNVKQFKVDKPNNFDFIPGQATEVSIDKPDWRDEKRPFTFTSSATGTGSSTGTSSPAT